MFSCSQKKTRAEGFGLWIGSLQTLLQAKGRFANRQGEAFGSIGVRPGLASRLVGLTKSAADLYFDALQMPSLIVRVFANETFANTRGGDGLMGLRTILQTAAWATNKRFGKWFPYTLRRRLYRWLYPPGSAKPMVMCIDVVGACNLRCPSCPVGNMGAVNRSGLMDVGLFERIVRKAATEFGVQAVHLYNWTEPLLHPRLPELIRLVKEHGLFCSLSSNLNVMRNIDEVLKAQPDDFRISLSGFTQEVYGQSHVQGDIGRVKANMAALSAAKKRLRATTPRIHVYFHKYRHNQHEVEPMRQMARELGFDWLEGWAYYMPLEKALDIAEGNFPETEREFIEGKFALPIVDAIEAARDFRDERCSLLEDQLILDVHGNLSLCCAVYDAGRNKLGRFLDMTRADVDKAKTKHPTCARCAKHGLHMYSSYHDNPALMATYEKLAVQNLAKDEVVLAATAP
jgi:pyruvate-formate lyase-activating enzyme